MCPSINDFLKFYSKGDYHKAIGVSISASLQEIRDAIDIFEVEYTDRSSEWGIQMAKIKEALLDPAKDNNKKFQERIKKTTCINAGQRRKAELVLSEAGRLLDLGQFGKALGLCDEAIRIDSVYVKAYLKKALIYWVKGEINYAIKYYEKSAMLKPEEVEAYLGLGSSYSQINDLEKAISAFKKVIALDPANARGPLNKMEAEICLGKYNDAIGTYGAWRKDIIFPKDELIGASLVCIALALSGKDYDAYSTPLLNYTITLRERPDWSAVEIDRHLEELDRKGFFPDRVARAKKVQTLFKEHFE